MKLLSCFTFITLLFCSCGKENSNSLYQYGSENPEAIHHFNKGWEYILDYGLWTLSEESFRKAVLLDSNFIIGKSLVGKSTTNLQERVNIFNELKSEVKNAAQDDQLLLEITIKTLELFNARDLNQNISQEFIEDFYRIGMTNYKKFVHKHPDESYMKAEYIEFLHAVLGPQQALDSLNYLASENQKQLPFFISYAAMMESKMGRYTEALDRADMMNELINDPEIPAPFVLYAQIYFDMDSLSTAHKMIDKAIYLDNRHIIAHRLKKKIESSILVSGEE